MADDEENPTGDIEDDSLPLPEEAAEPIDVPAEVTGDIEAPAEEPQEIEEPPAEEEPPQFETPDTAAEDAADAADLEATIARYTAMDAEDAEPDPFEDMAGRVRAMNEFYEAAEAPVAGGANPHQDDGADPIPAMLGEDALFVVNLTAEQVTTGYYDGNIQTWDGVGWVDVGDPITAMNVASPDGMPSFTLPQRVLCTQNGGEYWFRQEVIPYLLYGVTFADAGPAALSTVSVHPCESDGSGIDTGTTHTLDVFNPSQPGCFVPSGTLFWYIKEGDSYKAVGYFPVGKTAAPDAIPQGTTEAVESTTWAIGSTAVTVNMATRPVYNAAGDQILYYMYRLYSFDSLGRLVAISGETRAEVTTPVLCPGSPGDGVVDGGTY